MCRASAKNTRQPKSGRWRVATAVEGAGGRAAVSAAPNAANAADSKVVYIFVVYFVSGCRVPPGCGCDAAVPVSVQAELYALLGCVELGQVAHHTDGRLVELRPGGEACSLSGALPPPPPRPPRLPARGSCC